MRNVDPIIDALRSSLGEAQVLDSFSARLARAHDASIYRLVPRVVVRPRGIDDVRATLAIAREGAVGVTFRAGGTSLSGQAVTDGILLELGRDWRDAFPAEDGLTITSQPGVTGGRLNQLLARYRRKIGPDPASIASAMIGGIVANNASGMCCGTHSNSYQTMVGMRLVLADGFTLDTRLPNAAQTLERERPALHAGLLRLRECALENSELLARIRRKYAIKNTMGYSLNALVDFERPLDILTHLMVGSEGTLGFVAEVTLRTVPDPVHQATALAYFADLREAGAAVEPLANAGAAVLEIMDRASMAALQSEMHYPFALPEGCAALLVEFQEESEAALVDKTAQAVRLLSAYQLLAPVEFTQEPARRAHYWKLRKGLFPKVGGERPPGTAVIIEDICLPRARLAEAVVDLRALFVRHGFGDAVIFGHAKDGNLHFVLCHDFSRPEKIAQYAALMDGLAELVVHRYDGSLKAEHGTGRNMAPFVRLEWGEELHSLMVEVKRLLDPQGILNPGVLLTDDARSHLRALKMLPPVEPLVDKCIECGFCERVCPSRDLTLTPRQRIALQREQRLLDGRNARELQIELEREYAYQGIATCAGDGLCATVCPVGIDTGAYMRKLKAGKRGGLALAIARQLARHFALVATLSRWGLRLANLVSKLGLPLPLFPKRIPLPRPARAVSWPESTKPKVVYFSACLNQVMGGSSASAGARVLEKCGFALRPLSTGTVCCGQPFASKGFPEAATESARRWLALAWRASEEGRLPIVSDTSPCTARLVALGTELAGEDRARWEKLRIFDFPTFLSREVLPTRASWPRLERKLVLHPTCSTMKSEAVSDLLRVARTFASDVSLPLSAGCCGFAGDKGFSHPELTLSATHEEGREVRALVERAREKGQNVTAYSTCQTCSLGMKAATGLDYEPIAQLCLDAILTDL